MRETGSSDDRGRQTVSRRRFVSAAGATGLAVALAGCPGSDGSGGDGIGTTEPGPRTGTATGTATPERDGTVTWSFDPDAVRDHGDAITRALYESGLPEDVTVELVPSDPDREQRRADFDRVLTEERLHPDLFLVDHGWANVLAERDQILDLSTLLDDEAATLVEEEYFDGVGTTARDDESDAVFGVPLFVDVSTMQYRIDLVEAAGYDPVEENWATEPMTWEEWSHVVADVLDHAGVEFGYTTQWDIYEGTACCTFNEVLSSWGGAYFGGRENLFGPVGDRPVTVDASPVVQSVNMMRKFVHDEEFDGLETYAGGFTPTDILGWLEEDSWEPFVRGNAVTHRNWTSALAAGGRAPDGTDAPALGENLGVMPMPYTVPEAGAQAQGAGGTTAALDGWHAVVNPNSEDLDAVAAVLDAAMEPSFQLELFERQGWLPPRPDLFDDERARSVPVLGRYLDTLRVAGENVMSHPATRVWNDQASVVAQQANLAVARELSAETAMTDLKRSLEEIERTG